MGKGLLFFCCSCCILVLTIVNLSIGPIINHKTEMSGTMNCAQLQDNYDDDAKKGTLTDEQKNIPMNGTLIDAKTEKLCMIWNIHLLFLILLLDLSVA